MIFTGSVKEKGWLWLQLRSWVFIPLDINRFSLAQLKQGKGVVTKGAMQRWQMFMCLPKCIKLDWPSKVLSHITTSIPDHAKKKGRKLLLNSHKEFMTHHSCKEREERVLCVCACVCVRACVRACACMWKLHPCTLNSAAHAYGIAWTSSASAPCTGQGCVEKHCRWAAEAQPA